MLPELSMVFSKGNERKGEATKEGEPRTKSPVRSSTATRARFAGGLSVTRPLVFFGDFCVDIGQVNSRAREMREVNGPRRFAELGVYFRGATELVEGNITERLPPQNVIVHQENVFHPLNECER